MNFIELWGKILSPLLEVICIYLELHDWFSSKETQLNETQGFSVTLWFLFLLLCDVWNAVKSAFRKHCNH